MDGGIELGSTMAVAAEEEDGGTGPEDDVCAGGMDDDLWSKADGGREEGTAVLPWCEVDAAMGSELAGKDDEVADDGR